MSPLAAALRPMRHYADFRGRSTRTELVFFYLLAGLLGLAGRLAAMMAGIDDWWIMGLVSLALLCPSAALAMRRLHDTGRGGWWLLLALPWLAVRLWDERLHRSAPFAFPPPGLGPWIEAPAGLCSLALLILLLWTDEEAPNRYGPNPRYDAPGEPG
jgi:uncharacterized membrane protein YhaH (DUF805 family)